MTPKRVHPSSNPFDSHERRENHPYESSLGQIPLAKKKLKKDHISLEWNYFDQQPQDQAINGQKEEDVEYTDLFGQQFHNLRACSFKTISKAGQDKISLFGKNDVAQFDGQFQSAKKKPSFIHMSEEKLRYSDSKDRNRVTGSQRFIGFESMNQISKFEKKHSVDCERFIEPLQKNRRRQSSIAGSLHTINTQMMNDIMEFNIKDENQIDGQYLKNMLDMALIKNVVFTANLLIKFLERKGQQKHYSNLKIYKLLDVDGFSITGFYSETQKTRINLTSPITNKEFQKKINNHSQSHITSQRHKVHSNKQRGVQFKGTFYRNETYDWQEVIFYLSDVKDLQKSHHIKEPSCERLSFENFITIPEAQQCVQMSGNYSEKSYGSMVMK